MASSLLTFPVVQLLRRIFAWPTWAFLSLNLSALRHVHAFILPRSSARNFASTNDVEKQLTDERDPDVNDEKQDARERVPESTIQMLMNSPTLFSPIRRPRLPIVLCHGAAIISELVRPF
jgi:hypothetical protein